MKKTQIIILVTGLTSFFLTLVFATVTTFVFIKEARHAIGSTSIKEALNWSADVINEYTGSNVIRFDDGTTIELGEVHVDDHNGTIVDVDANGVNVQSNNGDTVDVGFSGINVVEPDGQQVHVGLDGIRIQESEATEAAEE